MLCQMCTADIFFSKRAFQSKYVEKFSWKYNFSLVNINNLNLLYLLKLFVQYIQINDKRQREKVRLSKRQTVKCQN